MLASLRQLARPIGALRGPGSALCVLRPAIHRVTVRGFANITGTTGWPGLDDAGHPSSSASFSLPHARGITSESQEQINRRKNKQKSKSKVGKIKPRRTRAENREQGGRCAAYCTGESYDLDKLQGILQDHRLVPSVYPHVVHVSYSHDTTNGLTMHGEREQYDNQAHVVPRFPHYEPDEAFGELEVRNIKDIFFYQDGAVVFWGSTKVEEELWLQELKTVQEDFNVPEFSQERFVEKMSVFQAANSGVINDCIILSDTSTDELVRQQQLAVSDSLVRSLKLDVLESLLSRALTRMRPLASDLKRGSLPQANLCREMVGEQLELRGMINLYSELLETPELYWEEPLLEQLFNATEENLEIDQRIATLNTRLSHAQEITGIAQSYLHQRESNFAEVVIIILIMIEVIFHFLDHSEYWRAWTWEGILGIEGPTTDEKGNKRRPAANAH